MFVLESYAVAVIFCVITSSAVMNVTTSRVMKEDISRPSLAMVDVGRIGPASTGP